MCMYNVYIYMGEASAVRALKIDENCLFGLFLDILYILRSRPYILSLNVCLKVTSHQYACKSVKKNSPHLYTTIPYTPIVETI